MKPSVALLVGDLSYSDGQHDIWDYFGLLAEPV